MKKVFFLFFFTSIFYSYKSQNNIVEYKIDVTTGGVLREFLFYNDNESYYFDYVNEDAADIHTIFTEYDIRYGSKKAYRKLDNLDHILRLSYFPREGSTIYLFVDDKPKINWKIDNVEKTILGYKCKKAIGSFRGREYIAWFTDEIPLSIGPWNLDGLPGLVLAAEDNDRIYSYEAVKIVKNTNLKIPLSVSEFIKNYDVNKLKKYREFIIKEDEKLKLMQSHGRANMPVNTIPTEMPSHRELMREFSFEWD